MVRIKVRPRVIQIGKRAARTGAQSVRKVELASTPIRMADKLLLDRIVNSVLDATVAEPEIPGIFFQQDRIKEITEKKRKKPRR